ncbi:MAG: tyrosine-type recombinase/integrase [Chitinophagales bacterium]|nr:tyrosine-type recombinase/integrase [Chitinophagales bacterium]
MKEEISTFVNYLRVEKKYSEHTAISYGHDLNTFLDYCNEVYEIANFQEVGHIHIRSWIVSLISDGISPVSVNRKISALRSMYKWMIRRNLIVNNPMLKVVAPKMPKRLPVVVQDLNMQKIIERPILVPEADTDIYAKIRDNFVMVLLYSTGIRRAELVGLKISDFNISRKEVRIVGKGNKVRSIPLTDFLIQQLEGYLEARNMIEDNGTENLFLTNKGKPIYPRLVHDIVKGQLDTLTTLSKKSPHVLRHTFATHMLDNGADLNGIKEILGHANLAATQIYTHSSIQKLKEVYKKAHPGAQDKK